LDQIEAADAIEQVVSHLRQPVDILQRLPGDREREPILIDDPPLLDDQLSARQMVPEVAQVFAIRHQRDEGEQRREGQADRCAGEFEIHRYPCAAGVFWLPPKDTIRGAIARVLSMFNSPATVAA
jgi:hypothetical protein